MKDTGKLKPPSPFHPRTKVTGFSCSISINYGNNEYPPHPDGGLNPVSQTKPIKTHLLQHSQKRALRPVPQEINFLVEQAGKPVPKRIIDNGAIS